MNVRIISITTPLVHGIKTAEELIVYCARVSNPSNQLNTGTGHKLLAYCIKHGHWSVFEQASMCVEVKTSRAVAAQILRHRSMSFQELSQRYTAVDEREPIEWRKQGETNRQVGDEPFELPTGLNIEVASVQSACNRLYAKLLEAGVARECARNVLPLNTQTTIYMNGTVRSWIHYFAVRCDSHTQKEHRDVALAARDEFIFEFPVISKALGYI